MLGLIWFRQDLRLRDNPAIDQGAKNHDQLVAIYIYSGKDYERWEPGGAGKWWLHESLKALQNTIKDKNGELIIDEGDALEILQKLCKKESITDIYCNRCYEPALLKQEEKIQKSLKKEEITLHVFDGNILIHPDKIRTKEDNVYQVYTPFWKAVSKEDITKPHSIPRNLRFTKAKYAGKTLEKLGLYPSWNLKDIPNEWSPGENGAQNKFRYFLKNKISEYKKKRDLPGEDSTSKLSPHLHFGEISPKEIWHRVQEENVSNQASAERFLQELVWREFSYHMLYNFPKTPTENLRDKFDKFPWEKNTKLLKAWQKGETGIPIVDAGMRQLWQTGWMHNRVRMIVASFLIKDCFIHWLEGAKWFWDTLVDADLADNTMGWQWTAGSGADAAPYFRIFNPFTQAERYDPNGEYIRKFVPELSKLPTKHLFNPSEAPKEVLEEAGIKLGKDYPKPIVDHHKARNKALDAFKKIK